MIVQRSQKNITEYNTYKKTDTLSRNGNIRKFVLDLKNIHQLSSRFYTISHVYSWNIL